MTLAYLASTTDGHLFYHGHSYSLSPITYPNVNIHNILVMGGTSLARSICMENKGFITGLDFDATRIPGFPKPLDMDVSSIPPGKRLMLLRAGGIGDLIMFTPALRHLRQRCRPGVKIMLSTFEDRKALFEDLGLVDMFYPHPIRLSDLVDSADFYVDFSDKRGIFNHVDMIDFHLDCLGMDPSGIPWDQKIPAISSGLSRNHVIREEIKKISGHGHSQATVLYSPGASDRIRYLPDDILKLLASNFKGINFVVPGKIPISCEHMENVFSLDTSSGLDAFVTAIATTDALVSTDSSAYHIAAALGTPSLVFFGPISSSIRTRYYPNVVALEACYFGETCASPCGISALTETPPVIPIGANRVRILEKGTTITTHSGKSFIFDPSRGCPEAQLKGSDISPCLKSFNPKDIIQGFEKVLSMIASPTQEEMTRSL